METTKIVQERKNHAMEALERRFSVAKAETHHQQGRDKRRRNEAVVQAPKASVAPSIPSAKSSSARTQGSSLKKVAEVEEEGLTYSRITQPVHENLLTDVKISSKEKSMCDKILHEILQKGDSAQKYIQGSRGATFDNYIVLDNFVQRHNTSGARLQALKRNSKRSKRHMSMKQLKKCGSLDLPSDFKKFENFVAVHEMWKEYVMQLLKNVGKNQVAQCLLGADLHGAILRVVECKKINAFVGVMGIMIRETAETFGVITQENIFRVVPKRDSVFVLQVDCWRITLYGDKCTSRMLGS